MPGVSGDLSRDFGLQVDHAFRRWLIGTAKIGYGIDDYVGLARIDQRWFASIGLIYKLTREHAAQGEIRRDWLISTRSGRGLRGQSVPARRHGCSARACTH